MKFIHSIFAAIWRMFFGIVNLPVTMLMSAAGLTGGQRMPDTPPVFTPPGDTEELNARLNGDHQRVTTIRNLESDAVTAVYKLRNAADRSFVNLEAVEREDVQDLLIAMKPSELDALTRAGRPAILNCSGPGIPASTVSRGYTPLD